MTSYDVVVVMANMSGILILCKKINRRKLESAHKKSLSKNISFTKCLAALRKSFVQFKQKVFPVK